MSYSLHKTGDGSFTLHNAERDEHYHSHAGAYQEARIKYFEPCHIAELAERESEATIFEVGFGLGYNVLPILDFLAARQEGSPLARLRYISTEIDTNIFPELLSKIDELYPEAHRDAMRNLLEHRELELPHLSVQIKCGDARQAAQQLADESIDAIFHDPFSPYKNSECWTVQFFAEEFRALKPHGVLSTYSMSTPVRAGMQKAGFLVYDGIGDESKTTGTLASKSPQASFAPLAPKMREKLASSPDRFPFEDDNFCLDHADIKKRRLHLKNQFLNAPRG